ncbi:unnamed protein product, partial [Choristocarpus tenellus]
MARQDDVVEALLVQARLAVDRLEPELGLQFYERALKSRPDDVALMCEVAEVMLQVGNTEVASQVLNRSISLSPDQGAEKYLYMGQLHEGLDSLTFYEKGLQILHRDLLVGDQQEATVAVLKQKLCSAYCSVAELFLTDLCFESDAEGRCQAALNRSMEYDCGGPEPLHAMANLRLSQCNMQEAASCAEEAYKRLATC